VVARDEQSTDFELDLAVREEWDFTRVAGEDASRPQLAGNSRGCGGRVRARAREGMRCPPDVSFVFAGPTALTAVRGVGMPQPTTYSGS